jgi:hypothetical protein
MQSHATNDVKPSDKLVGGNKPTEQHKNAAPKTGGNLSRPDKPNK